MLARFRIPTLLNSSPRLLTGARFSPYRYTTMTQSELETTTPAQANSPQAIPKHQTLALPESEDDPDIRNKYRPFILNEDPTTDWVSTLELTTALQMAATSLQTSPRLKVLVLYGSLRKRSYSRLVALEASRILFRLGCDVRVYDPTGLPVKNDVEHGHPKVQELRELSRWSDGHLWVSPEQHGNLVRFFLPFPKIQSFKTQLTISDGRIQKPNRLDPAQHRERPPNTGTHTSHRPSMRRLAVLQRSELAPDIGSVDAHVHNPEPVVDPASVHAFPR